LKFQREVRTPSFEWPITTVVAKRFLVNEVDLFEASMIWVSLFRQPGVGFPRPPIVAPEIQVLTEPLVSFLQIFLGHGTLCSAKQGRGVSPELNSVHKMHNPAEHGRDPEHDR
jgi:hypothetical protein